MTHSIHDVGRRQAKFLGRSLGLGAAIGAAWPGFSPQAAFSADKDKGQQISRVIAKEMTAAHRRRCRPINGPKPSRIWTRRKPNPD
jgi:hypothetical protein